MNLFGRLSPENKVYFHPWGYTLPLVLECARDYHEQNGSCFSDDELANDWEYGNSFSPRD